jgi:hypothetical protein
MVTRTVPEQVNDWKVMCDNLEPLLRELPYVAPLRRDLERLIAEASRLEAEQTVLTGKLRRVNEERAELLVRGQEVRDRLASMLRSHFGGKSKELIQFGFKPRAGGRPRKSRRRQPPPEPAPETAG